MKIVHAASELYPYMKTGGLADAVAAMAGALADNGHEVSVFLPGYRAVLEHKDAAGAVRKLRLKIEMGDQFLSGDVRVFSPRKNLQVYLICREEFFDRRAPYGNGERDFEDNSDRFVFFCKGVVETLRLADLQADVVRSHDWAAALLPRFLRESERRHRATLALATVFMIHTIADQGLFPAMTFARTNRPDELYPSDGLEDYAQVNYLKGGMRLADGVAAVGPRYARRFPIWLLRNLRCTVSPRYAREIKTPEFGGGLDGVAETRADDRVGLFNGVDTAVGNPAVDARLFW